MECTIKIGGEAGQGAQSIESLLISIFSKLYFYFFATKNYMSRIRGGHNFHMIRVSDVPVHALRGDTFDIIVALDTETKVRHQRTLAKGGIYISKEQTDEIITIAKNEYKESKASNSIIAALIVSMLGITLEDVQAVAADDTVRNYFTKGYELSKRWKFAEVFPVKAKARDMYVLNGNQALSLGAICGGCQFMAGYPMTPSTSIMDHFSKAAHTLPIHFEQAEDEISAINMAIGASYAGLRAMVATSGGGFALMQEGVSLAGMTETPIVIIDSQRPAPATGLPTRTEQADLEFILHSGHGEFPRVIYAPGSVEEALSLAQKSFQVSDDHQVPVFILTDQYLADSIQLVSQNVLPDMSTRDYIEGTTSYKRYQLTKDGVSPLTYPGLSEALVQVDSDEHDEAGHITEDLDLRVKMVDKRLKKMKLLEKSVVMPTCFGDIKAKTVIISWGSNKQIVEEAVMILNASKVKTAALHFSQVYPLTQKMIAKYGLSKKKIICIENNATGQFARLLKRELEVIVTDTLLKYNGECFMVDEVVSKVRKLVAVQKRR